jgi:hypothetical protein
MSDYYHKFAHAVNVRSAGVYLQRQLGYLSAELRMEYHPAKQTVRKIRYICSLITQPTQDFLTAAERSLVGDKRVRPGAKAARAQDLVAKLAGPFVKDFLERFKGPYRRGKARAVFQAARRMLDAEREKLEKAMRDWPNFEEFDSKPRTETYVLIAFDLAAYTLDVRGADAAGGSDEVEKINRSIEDAARAAMSTAEIPDEALRDIAGDGGVVVLTEDPNVNPVAVDCAHRFTRALHDRKRGRFRIGITRHQVTITPREGAWKLITGYRTSSAGFIDAIRLQKQCAEGETCITEALFLRLSEENRGAYGRPGQASVKHGELIRARRSMGSRSPVEWPPQGEGTGANNQANPPGPPA